MWRRQVLSVLTFCIIQRTDENQKLKKSHSSTFYILKIVHLKKKVRCNISKIGPLPLSVPRFSCHIVSFLKKETSTKTTIILSFRNVLDFSARLRPELSLLRDLLPSWRRRSTILKVEDSFVCCCEPVNDCVTNQVRFNTYCTYAGT